MEGATINRWTVLPYVVCCSGLLVVFCVTLRLMACVCRLAVVAWCQCVQYCSAIIQRSVRTSTQLVALHALQQHRRLARSWGEMGSKPEEPANLQILLASRETNLETRHCCGWRRWECLSRRCLSWRRKQQGHCSSYSTCRLVTDHKALTMGQMPVRPVPTCKGHRYW
jgi:hypothetical protein